MKCDCCGIESPVEQAFSPVARVFQSPLQYCPPCSNKRQTLILNRCLLFFLLTTAILILFAVTIVRPKERAETLFLPFCLLWLILGMIWHELGHALIGIVFGLRVFRVSFGLFGRTLWQRQLFGTVIEFKSNPLGGMVWASPRTLLMMEDPAFLEEADRYSQEALQMIPWVALIQGTRGSVLVELGRVDEGLVLLKHSLEETEDPCHKATDACYLAIALVKQGDHDEARQYLAQARTLDPDCPLIARVLQELS